MGLVEAKMRHVGTGEPTSWGRFLWQYHNEPAGTASERPPHKAFPAALEVEALEIGPELVRQVGTGQRELHGRLEESQLLPGVVPLALELDGVDGPASPQRAKGVGELHPAWSISQQASSRELRSG